MLPPATIYEMNVKGSISRCNESVCHCGTKTGRGIVLLVFFYHQVTVEHLVLLWRSLPCKRRRATEAEAKCEVFQCCVEWFPLPPYYYLHMVVCFKVHSKMCNYRITWSNLHLFFAWRLTLLILCKFCLGRLWSQPEFAAHMTVLLVILDRAIIIICPEYMGSSISPE